MGLNEASHRINSAAEVGADLGLIFPRNKQEMEDAPKVCNIPLVYVQSRGNRDGRPLFSRQELQELGYAMCIDAQVVIAAAFVAQRDMLKELRETGDYKTITAQQMVEARQEIEDIIDLSNYYEIEAATVES